MSLNYKSTSLWKNTFEAEGFPETQFAARSRLLVALNTLDERVAALLSKIDADCRGLTIHDISHVHQLWSVASEVCGPEYSLNPLEGFVLGAAFLIHDAGLTAAAYPDGVTGLRQTPYYRDRVAALLRSAGNDIPDENTIDTPSPDLAQRALFDALRAIHSKRAETLLDESKVHPLTGESYSFFPDADLYLDCGEVIGPIAASHYWNIEAFDERFQAPLTPPASFPGWEIDAAKLACILRAADACAIDERRARIMPFLLIDPRGVSRDHWIFQAYLKPGERRKEALLFQSKRPFPRQHMAAWWVAYDSINIADRELRNCDRLLRDRTGSGKHPGLGAFAARRVEGAGEPSHLKEHVEVSGWTPVDTAVRINNPIKLIEKLGGWQLYGRDFSAPLREALQNAADAVRARRRRSAAYVTTQEYQGRIDIRLECDPTDKTLKKLKLFIADDGVGMPPDVLTGSLLDFGRSFWDSTEAAEKYPGLLTDPQFKPTGKFGIGFYSIFMIADDVKIISKPWDAGIKDYKVLHFQNGLEGRAEFRDFNAQEDGASVSGHSTVLTANVKHSNWLGHLGSLSLFNPSTDITMEQFWKQLTRVLKSLVFALDVECWLSYGGLRPQKLNEPGIMERPADDFARCYGELSSPDDPNFKGFTQEEIPLIEGIADQQGRVHTRGCIALGHENGRWHIGGFQCFGFADNLMKGMRAGIPVTASRGTLSSLASKQELREWGTSQLARLINSSVDGRERIVGIAKLSAIDVDVREVAMLIADDKPATVTDIVSKLGQRAKIFVMGQRARPPFVKSPFVLDANGFFNFNSGDITHLKHDLRVRGIALPGVDSYFEIFGSLSDPTNRNSAYGALHQALNDAGFRITIEGPDEYVIGIYNGPKGGRGYLSVRDLVKGSKIKRFGFVMKLERLSSSKMTASRRAPRRSRRRKSRLSA